MSGTKKLASDWTGGVDAVEETDYVEEILDCRMRNGKVEYFIKLKGCSAKHNVWELEEKLNCPASILAYEQQRKNEAESAKSVKHATTSEPEAVAAKKKEPAAGFDRGLQPEKIMGATLGSADRTGQLMFLMKWKDLEEADMVPAKQANIVCPQIVIQFYEEHLAWKSSVSSGNKH